MSGTTRSSSDLDPRRRRILFRAWHRGMRETDLIMGRFCDAEIASLSEGEIEAFEALIEAPDADILAWVTGERPAPAAYDTGLLAKLRAFHHGAGQTA